MPEFRFMLMKRGKKIKCPACGKKTAVPYIDYGEGDKVILNETVCRCDREINCGYHYTPSQYFKDNPDKKPSKDYTVNLNSNVNKKMNMYTQPVLKPKVNIPEDFAMSTVKANNVHNKFIIYLSNLFDKVVVNRLIDKYNIGTSNGAKWWGCASGECVVFWFKNKNGEIRAGQVKLFDSSGHTAKWENSHKEIKSCTGFAHDLYKRALLADKLELPNWLNDYIQQVIYVDCFFGEHLINLPENINKPIAIVESPKSCIVASVFFPQFVWVAVGALSYLTPERCKVLTGRNVVLFPDLGAYDIWKDRVSDMKDIATFSVSDNLEKIATSEQRIKGLDICDYLETDEVKGELKENFKKAIRENANDNPSEQWDIWVRFRDIGLREQDRIQAGKELLNEGFILIDK